MNEDSPQRRSRTGAEHCKSTQDHQHDREWKNTTMPTVNRTYNAHRNAGERHSQCAARTKSGRCKESAVRLITINGARVWVCRDCYEAVEMHDAQPMVVNQRTGIWITDRASATQTVQK
jgi:hypothetical protein